MHLCSVLPVSIHSCCTTSSPPAHQLCICATWTQCLHGDYGTNCYLLKVFYQHHWAVLQPYWLLLSLLNFSLAAHFTSGEQLKTTGENIAPIVSVQMKLMYVAAAFWQANAQRGILPAVWRAGEQPNWIKALHLFSPTVHAFVCHWDTMQGEQPWFSDGSSVGPKQYRGGRKRAGGSTIVVL